jgi:hypothetical protein
MIIVALPPCLGSRPGAAEGMFNTVFGEFNLGSMPEDAMMRSLCCSGEQVIPKLRAYEPF